MAYLKKILLHHPQSIVQNMIPNNTFFSVISAPTFIVSPAPLEVLEGDSVRFFGKVHGKPLPKVTWFKDGQTIDGDDDMKVQQKENSRKLEVETWLKMANGGLEHDSLNYQVVAENSAGSAQADFSLTGIKTNIQ